MNLPIGLDLFGGALGTGLVLAAMPLVLVMTVWTAYTMARILFPDGEKVMGRAPASRVTTQARRTVQTRVHDLTTPNPVRTEEPGPPRRLEGSDGFDALMEDLWLRRN